MNYPRSYDSYLALVDLVEAGVPVDEQQRGLVDYYAGQYAVAIAAFDRYMQEEGADVAVVDINRDTARKVADDVKALGHKSLAIEADLIDSKQVTQAVQETVDTFGKIDIQVNNVGGLGKIARARTSLRFVDQKEAEWDENFELNLMTH